MKILHIVGTYIPGWRAGGPIKSVSSLCSKQVQLGHDVHVYTTNMDGREELDVPLDKTVIIDGVKVNYYKGFIPSYTLSISLARAIKRNVRNFDLVHIHSVLYWPTIPASIYCKKFNIPFIISPRGILDPICLKKGRIKKLLYGFLIERANLKRADFIHFTSEEEREHSYIFGLKIQSQVVPNGINLKEFSHMPERGIFRRAYPQVKDKPMILFMSRISWIKGLDLLIKAFSNVVKQNNDVILVIAGPDSDGFAWKVKNWINEYGINERIIFTGMLLDEKKLSALVDADIFCLPSYHENFSMSAAEAMACGLPLIISDEINISPEIKKAHAGLVVKCDPKEITTAIFKLLNDIELRSRLAANGKKLVKEIYDIGKVAKQMINLYNGTIEMHKNNLIPDRETLLAVDH